MNSLYTALNDDVLSLIIPDIYGDMWHDIHMELNNTNPMAFQLIRVILA